MQSDNSHDGEANGAIKRIVDRFPHLSKRLGGMPFVGIEEDDRDFSKPLIGVKEGFELLAEALRDWKPGDYNFTNGNPLPLHGFGPCVDAMIDCLKSTKLSRYPYSEGDDNLRLEILKYFESLGFKNDNPYNYDDIRKSGLSINNLTFTTSTSDAFRYIIRMLVKKDDVILTTGPNYGLFSLRAEWNRARLEILETYSEDGFILRPELLEKKIKEINNELKEKAEKENLDYIPRVVCFINANPNNPMGTVIDNSKRDVAESIVRICKDNDIIIIDDLIYRDIVYDKKKCPVALQTIDGAFQNVITITGLSKSYNLAGIRAGVVIADEVIIRQLINKIFRYSDANSHLNAVALAAAFNTSDERNREANKYFTYLRREYLRRLDLVTGLVYGFNEMASRFNKDIALSHIEKLNLNPDEIINGLHGIEIVKRPDAGYFIVLNMNILKNTSYISSKTNEVIRIENEKDLLLYFYQEYKVRYLPGMSILWPNKEDFIARFTFAKSFDELILGFYYFGQGVKRLLDSKK